MDTSRTALKDINNKIREFITSRQRPETQADAAFIIKIFCDALSERDGWIRTSEIQKKALKTGRIKSQKTLFRFLKELEELGIIEKEGRIEFSNRSHSDKKKENVYYRLGTPGYRPDIPNLVLDRVALRYAQLAAAKDILKELGIEDPDAAIAERVDQMYGVHVVPDDETTEN